MPASIWCTPPRMFIVVDLPEPFSPTRPSTWPAREREADARAGPRRRRSSCRGPRPRAAASAPRRHGHRRAVTAPVNRAPAGDGAGVDHGREQDDAALDREDRGERQAEQLQALVDDREEQDAEDRPDDLALAAEQADAADHRRADDVEQDALAEDRRAGLEPRRCRGSRRSPRSRPEMTKAQKTTRRTGTPETAAARGLRPTA